MSLATLKAKYKQTENISRNGTFSLNGGHRNNTYIGKTMNHNQCRSNDATVVKKSSINTKGLIITNYSSYTHAKPVVGLDTSSKHTGKLKDEAELCDIINLCEDPDPEP